MNKVARNMIQDTITPSSIKLLVDTFYLKIREVPELQSIFENKIGTTKNDWEPHLEKMYSFWNSILLRERSYHGRPLDAHRDLPYFPPDLFEVWLKVFKETADSIFTADQSIVITKRAETVAQSLKAGMY